MSLIEKNATVYGFVFLYDNVFLHFPQGEPVNGTVELQVSNNYRRILMTNTIAILKTSVCLFSDVFKAFFKPTPISIGKALSRSISVLNGNAYNQFCFYNADIENGRKKIRCLIYMDKRLPKGVCGAVKCYDMEKNIGYQYAFELTPNGENIRKWADELGVAIEYTDLDEIDDMYDEYWRRYLSKES